MDTRYKDGRRQSAGRGQRLCRKRVNSARGSLLAVAVVLLGSLGVMGAPASAATTAPASGFNDWSCRPSTAHPFPAVLIHGLGSNAQENWSYVGPGLASAGYCAFSLTYGASSPLGPSVGGTAPISQSAQQIAAFVGQVLATTGARKVDLVGHSEGAFMSLYVPKETGIAGRIDRVVALAPPTHGTSFAGLVTVANLLGLRPLTNTFLAANCPACNELIDGGSAVATLDNGPIAQAGVGYTIVASRTDLLVVPHQSTLFGTTETAFVPEAGVRNQYVQDICPLDPVGHVALAFDPDVLQMITNGLDPGHPTAVACTFGAPV